MTCKQSPTSSLACFFWSNFHAMELCSGRSSSGLRYLSLHALIAPVVDDILQVCANLLFQLLEERCVELPPRVP